MDLHVGNLLLVLLSAWAFGGVVERLGYPAILGELLAGILLGPPLLGILHAEPALEVLAQLGVLLMMMYVGMEIDPRELGKASWAGFLAAVGGFVTPFLGGLLVMRAFGQPPLSALFVAIALGVTSVAVKSRVLLDLKLLDTRIAHVLMAGSLLTDTLALVVFAAVLGVAESGVVSPGPVALAAGKAVAFFLVCGVVGYRLLPWFGRRLVGAGFKSRTLLFTLMLLTAFLFAELAELSGIHAILGAFLAGLFLREAIPDRKLGQTLSAAFHDVSIGFLAPLFFVLAGFHVSLGVLREDLGLLLAVVGVGIVAKVAGTLIFYLPTGHGWREGLAVGCGMNGRGAVEIVIAGIGLQMGLISQEIFSILVFLAILTTAVDPVLLKWSTDWLRSRGELIPSSEHRHGTVIVGAGSTARLIARHLSRTGPVTLVDSNPSRCALAEGEGFRVLCGNALREEVLSEAGAPRARTFLAMTGNAEVNVLAAQMAREVFMVPSIHVSVGEPERGAHEELIRPLQASMLFARPVDLLAWDHRVDRGAFRIRRIVVGEDGGRGVWESDPERRIPLLVESSDAVEVVHAGRALKRGDTVVCLEVMEEGGRA